MIERDREQLTVAPDGKPLAEQPKWRKEFPIDWPQDNYIVRREFTTFLVLTSGAFTAGQFWIGIQNFFRKRRGAPLMQLVARADELPVGGVKAFAYPDAHDSCPCHEGLFDLETGRPLAGPPRRPLAAIKLEQRNGEIYATGVELKTI
jgi:hypothetical protein